MSLTALIAGCSSDASVSPERAAEAPAEEAVGDLDQSVGSSQRTMISVDNQLTLPDGSPASVTWQVTGTQNSFWDGSSRPDHAPPQGFQGLVQEAGSGPYRARAEVVDNSPTKRPVFFLTPSVTVENQGVALEPLLMVYGSEGWEMALKNETVYGCGTSSTFTAQTPRGELAYQIIGKCPSLEPSFILKAVTE
jgi:hypothetical protein